mmetsp:Transcript_11015/g.23763  ORF Transcript_11015/g.23763 Transcript_11015/m.23763 type:complete len:852 (+) Transcript_11015:286-2841(+)|eukprot:CAMPEP_0202897936 /NCGR_PEP_ID=MMETSP1392-20130828/6557_1 /ASSEMBLY_ACC=CAM_ASM_000868 /TAXON_ID=225041 /ORGANISM="Chlamydomonas chlamydogama, Strain SAG 11-48b" /LENGTH=851 /DNA_ID=CAMNT_0049583707 /DNA_START=280 /DNA_END=2835 /DNA_ORIENTATION=+
MKQALLLGVGIVLALSCYVNAQEYSVVTGETDVLGLHAPRNVPDKTYLAKINESESTGSDVKKLNFQGGAPKDLASGYQVQLAVKQPSRRLQALKRRLTTCDPYSGEVCEDDIDVAAYNVTDLGSKRDFSPQNGIVKLSTIVFVLNVGGAVPPFNAATIRSYWLNQFNAKGASNTETMENYFKNCSYSKMQLSSNAGDWNEVVDLSAYPMPVIGRTAISNLPYDTTNNCNFFEMYAYQEWAQQKYGEIYRDTSRINNFVRRIVVMPVNNCPWYGTGSQGCFGKYCYIWVRGDRANFMNTYMHELGHTINLQHSSTYNWEYGDCSCVMGCQSQNGCFNAPTSIRAGWSRPIDSYWAANFTAGRWYRWTLPAVEFNDVNTIRIFPNWTTPSWSGSSLPAYYLSFRRSVGFNSAMLDQYDRKLNIHVYNGSDIYDFWRPVLLGNNGGGSGMVNGTRFNDTITRLIINFVNYNATHAEVRACRYTQTRETSCVNGLDDDCNGRSDWTDPACYNYVGFCGDDYCDPKKETVTNCPRDCPPVCGDGFCTHNETAANCPQDCPAICGDGYCDRNRRENILTCPADCPALCGDGICTAGAENARTCPTDCPAVCGDAWCDLTRGENCITCVPDCARLCGRRSLKDILYGLVRPASSRTLSVPEQEELARQQQEQAVLQKQWDAQRKLLEAPIVSPDGSIAPHEFSRHHRRLIGEGHLSGEHPEDITVTERLHGPKEFLPNTFSRRTLAAIEEGHFGQLDHPARPAFKPIVCGDNHCDDNEDIHNCAQDCCPSGKCGDGQCQGWLGENCETCPGDCAGDLEGEDGFCCGAFVGCKDPRCFGNGSVCQMSCTSPRDKPHRH